MKIDPLNKVPTFDINARMNDLNLVNLNNFFKGLRHFDVEKGTLGYIAKRLPKTTG
ncbi:MAG: hypothetical protein WDO16_03340 [Bacteroidota bacterium]